MSEQDTTYEYELVDISFDFGYELPEDEGRFVREDVQKIQDEPQIEYDDNGIPMGKTPEEIKMRKQIIFQFYEKWKKDHPEKAVFNKNLQSDILIRKESVVEASGHAPRRYKSTLAVLRLEEVLANAVKVDEDNPKKGDSNQEKLTKMLIMKYDFSDLGTIKLTVGVRRRSQDKIQYGITVLEEGEEIRPVNKSNTTKKAPHKSEMLMSAPEKRTTMATLIKE